MKSSSSRSSCSPQRRRDAQRRSAFHGHCDDGDGDASDCDAEADEEAKTRCEVMSAAELAEAGVDDGAGLDDFTPRSQKRLAAARSLREARDQYQRPRRAAANAPKVGFSGLLPADVDVLSSIAASLGASLASESEAHLATHLVVGGKSSKRADAPPEGAPKRTVKVLHAITRGAWLLSDAWLYASVEAGRLLPEGSFETASFAGARKAREAREAKAPLKPLDGLSVAVVETDADVNERLRTLATAAGGSLTSNTRASVWIGGKASAAANAGGGGGSSRRTRSSATDATVVSAEWLYDTISRGERMPFADYRATSAT